MVAKDLDSGRYLIERLEAQRSATLIQVGAVAGACLCVAIAASLQKPINARREQLQLVMQSNIYKELPPKYAWASAFGAAFRGLAVDVLWVRAENLKQEGKYYESHQLAKWICTLQPRFPEVWSFQSWNMSYNISVATHTPQERWQWIYNGIRLLRDEGIPNNERVVPLYRQLAYTWLHKVGDRMDDFHNYYKRQWAATMETLLGAPPVGLSDAQTIDWFRPVAEAPVRLADLIAKRPAVAKLVDQLSALGVDLNAQTDNQRVYHPLEVAFFRPYTRFLREEDLAVLRSKPLDLTKQEAGLETFLASSAGDDFDALLAWIRAKVLREQYKMDPAYMLQLTNELGGPRPIPIDWRTPWSQSIYWGKIGVERGLLAKNLKEFEHLNTDRLVVFSLQALANMGRYTFRINLDDPMKSFLAMGPDHRYIEAMHQRYLALGKIHAEEGEDVEGKTTEMLQSGHVNFLEDSVCKLYLAGRNDQAQEYLDYLARNYPNPETGKTKESYLAPLDRFVLDRYRDHADSYPNTLAIINSWLQQGYVALAAGEDAEFQRKVQSAKAIYDFYQEKAKGSPEGRLLFLPFPQIRSSALYMFLSDPTHPIAVRSAVWYGEDNVVKRYCYDYAIRDLRQLSESQGINVDAAFPEPPGMEQFRSQNQTPLYQEDIEKDTEDSEPEE